jgi:hypothetical protein
MLDMRESGGCRKQNEVGCGVACSAVWKNDNWWIDDFCMKAWWSGCNQIKVRKGKGMWMSKNPLLFLIQLATYVGMVGSWQPLSHNVAAGVHGNIGNKASTALTQPSKSSQRNTHSQSFAASISISL